MTYPDKKVQSVVNDEFVPVQVVFPDDVERRRRYGVKWTPTLVIVDGDGDALHKVCPASLPPEEFVPVVLAGLARALSTQKRFDEAVERFDRVVREYPRSLAAAESLYWRGVAEYGRDDKDAMKRSWTELGAKFPDSFWGKATTFVREKKPA